MHQNRMNNNFMICAAVACATTASSSSASSGILTAMLVEALNPEPRALIPGTLNPKLSRALSKSLPRSTLGLTRGLTDRRQSPQTEICHYYCYCWCCGYCCGCVLSCHTVKSCRPQAPNPTWAGLARPPHGHHLIRAPPCSNRVVSLETPIITVSVQLP